MIQLEVVFLFFLLAVVPACGGIERVLGVLEEDLSLLCLDSNVNSSCSHRARWQKYNTDRASSEVIAQWPNNFEKDKRVTVEKDKDGLPCLFLKTLQKSDAGFYSYEVHEAWNIVLVKNITLKVKDCGVLPPVTATSHTSVKLNCQLRTQKPEEISWAMLKGDNPLPVDLNRVGMNGTFLAFHSVNMNDSGWYRCTLGQSQRCADINLLVTEIARVATTASVTTVAITEEAWTISESTQVYKNELNSHSFTPVVVPVVIGILILVAGAGFFVYYRHKTQKHPQQHLGQQADLETYENLTLPHLQESGSRINTLYLFQDECLQTFQH